jgi:hypothetical protein
MTRIMSDSRKICGREENKRMKSRYYVRKLSKESLEEARLQARLLLYQIFLQYVEVP